MLTVHHMRVSQSERIVWLCEELEIKYDLKLHNRDPMFSPQAIKDLYEIGSAPVIQDGDLTMGESAACVEYIIHKHGDGRLALPPSHPNYADYVYWFAFSNGTLQPAVSRLMSIKAAGVDSSNDTAKRYQGKLDLYLRHVDGRLGRTNEWLAGEEFTAADIMTVFTLTTMRTFYSIDLSAYSNILAYLKRVVQRPGYKSYREKGDPELPLMIDGPAPENFLEKLKSKA
ncbi:glutathione S-transferase [Aureobasidium pullulans]|uniref:Glutathione S-transferase n=1 Tax=Aureobasidium pullulans TaxID=5580 RepID=A0A4S9SCA7_AURPU|nr:glutathione S-transferase [Aureobasidium pullulans]THZ11600.1 glutathione S-transferase [Aureobasidium pullulans]THZ75055.1 glutathione S-transferase [Aureobasidium pullulans]TIA21566.1 glutathione S-transferase [Aureobasidium pullulans]